MKLLGIFMVALLLVAAAVIMAAYICFRMAFYAPNRKKSVSDAIETPVGEIYDPFRADMIRWTKEVRAMPHESVQITSFDGLRLFGKYYEYAPGAPIELMFHGYRGTAERDLSGGVQRCFRLGHSALIVDQRCSGRSEGNVITFGICEHRDCLDWVAFMLRRFGPEVKIILTGISMGAATVMMTADKPLPENVIGILADCGYTSPKAIIQKVIGEMGIPPKVGYPFVKLGARLYGHFDLEQTSPRQALTKASVPVIFFHGEADDFVPCDMSRENFAACASRKKLVTVPGAGHGLSYPMATDTYLEAVTNFFDTERT